MTQVDDKIEFARETEDIFYEMNLGVEDFKDTEEIWEEFIKIYDEFLIKDELFHFFYEGPYITLRCSYAVGDRLVTEMLNNTNLGGTKRYFRDTKFYLVSWNNGWYESSDIVREFPEYFTKFFHMNSEFAIDYFKEYGYYNRGDYYLQYLGDRVIHCFFNTLQYLMLDDIKLAEKLGMPISVWESRIMKEMAHGRSFYAGMIHQQNVYRKYHNEMKNGNSNIQKSTSDT